MSLCFVWWKVPLKVHEWGKWNSSQNRFCIRLAVQTGTIVCCMCCIWDNISCCTLAISMSWCDGVIIPSLSISLLVQRQRHMFRHAKLQCALLERWGGAAFLLLLSPISWQQHPQSVLHLFISRHYHPRRFHVSPYTHTHTQGAVSSSVSAQWHIWVI